MATKFKLRRKTMMMISLLFGIALLFAIATCFISPVYIGILSFIGLLFPILVIINFILLCYWIKYTPKLLYLSAVPFIASLFFITRIFTVNLDSNPHQGIKIMTWNVKCFDLYNWSMNKETGEKMMNLIRKENPDVLCLQEFYTDENKFHNLEFLRDQLGFKYVHFYKTLTLRKTDHWGLATLSKYPIVLTKELKFENSKHNACLVTDIQINDRKMRVLNTHLQSIHLAYSDYIYIDQVKSNIKLSDVEKTKSIFRKLQKAYIYRAQQLEQIKTSCFNHHTILCGDFNDIPLSYTYQFLSKNMQDAFIEKGSGFSRTMNMVVPYLRIDYILASQDMQFNSYKRIKKNLSDHYPVISTLEMK